jgi:peptidoglycan/LPS O-acetylase OafA/YrhL
MVASQAKEAVRRNNNFNLLRIIAAGAVLVSHAYPICLGPGTPEPLNSTLGMTLGALAVLTFFAISGYFISQSFQNVDGCLEFAVARTLRIYPGLFAILLLTVFALGPTLTTLGLSDYFSDRETLLYIPRNLGLWPLQYQLPGVFNDNPYPLAINGSLWTLVYEVACYAMVAIVGTLGLALNERRFASFVIAFATCYVLALPLVRNEYAHLTMLRNIHFLALPFVIGMSLFHFRQHIQLRFSVLVVLGLASAFSYRSVWFQELFVIAWSYGIFYLGFLQCKPLQAYNRLGDYSYGTYIYAFPVEQGIAALYKGCLPVVMIALSLPLTLLCAIVSWHLIEQRALAQRSTVAQWCRRKVKPLGLSFSG